MFDFFTRKTPKEFQQAAEDIYKMVEPKKEPKEYYRVGRTDNGMTTLTMMSENGTTMTLTMNQSACKQMIRMLESTFDEEQPIEETQE